MSQKTKLFACFTAENVRQKDNFLASIRDAWEINVFDCGTVGEGGGDFGTPGFARLTRRKLELLRDKIAENAGRTLIWSDVDIQFFAPCNSLIEAALATNHIVFQSERWPEKRINAGFMAMRAGDRVRHLFTAALRLDIEHLPYFDQSAIEIVLTLQEHCLRWDILPRQFWAKSHMVPPPADMVLHHANGTEARVVDGVILSSNDQKLMQLDEVRTFMRQPLLAGHARRWIQMFRQRCSALRRRVLQKISRTPGTR